MSARTRLVLSEIRKRYLRDGAAPPPRLLGTLALDPRPGAQALFRALKGQREARRAEDIRLASLLNFERVLWKAGVERIAGVDEVGVGPLAGPVVAAAVILPREIDIAGIDDSKKLDPATRERLDREIRARAIAVSVAAVEVEEIDRVNIYHAGLEAMRRAVVALDPGAQHVLVDAREIPGLVLPQNHFDKGDGLDYSIACASIVAKVHRDAHMDELARAYPGYGFERHKGYSTPQHQAAVRRLGPCPIHRKSFPVLKQLAGEAAPLFYQLKEAIAAAASLEQLGVVAHRLGDPGTILPDTEARKLAVLLTRRRQRLA